MPQPQLRSVSYCIIPVLFCGCKLCLRLSWSILPNMYLQHFKLSCKKQYFFIFSVFFHPCLTTSALSETWSCGSRTKIIWPKNEFDFCPNSNKPDSNLRSGKRGLSSRITSNWAELSNLKVKKTRIGNYFTLLYLE
jgi:hypothetical protein